VSLTTTSAMIGFDDFDGKSLEKNDVKARLVKRKFRKCK
jgi:hypothetical protein